MAPFPAPKWAPKDKTVLLKEEIVAFHREVSRFHDCIKGVLQEFPDLAEKLTNTLEPLDGYTNKPQNLSHITELVIFLSDVQVLYKEAQRLHLEAMLSTRLTSSGPAPTECGRALKVALPLHFDRSSSKAHIFLAKCNNFMALNSSQFASNEICIQWALQLCTNKAANWKCVQLELTQDEYNLPAYLVS